MNNVGISRCPLEDKLNSGKGSREVRLLVHNSMFMGFSKYFRNSASHWAPTAPSTTLWSQLSVTDMMLATSYLRTGGRDQQSV